jgi:hypothetical protein
MILTVSTAVSTREKKRTSNNPTRLALAALALHAAFRTLTDQLLLDRSSDDGSARLD